MSQASHNDVEKPVYYLLDEFYQYYVGEADDKSRLEVFVEFCIERDVSMPAVLEMIEKLDLVEHRDFIVAQVATP